MSGFGAAKMKGKEAVCKTLPDDLVEKIVAMMPFPAIFKAKCLSKAWVARFSSISSQDDDEEKKGLAISFQTRVRELSGNWETFYPVFAGDRNFVAYDRSSRERRGMPSLSYLPHNVMDRSFLEVEGALLYGYGKSEISGCDLYVTNYLTRTWKRLPRPPNVYLNILSRAKLVTVESLKTYKLILIMPKGRMSCSIRIYDSKSNSWSSNEIVSNFVSGESFDSIAPVCLDGVLYNLNSERPQHFRTVNLEEGTIGELTFSLPDDVREIVALGLAVWNGKVLMIVNAGLRAGQVGTQQVLKILQIDMASLRLIEVARHPTPDSYRRTAPSVSSGSCIFFYCRSEMLLYNFNENQWSYFPFPTDMRNAEYVWLKGACRPGLSPFLEV